MLWYVLFSIVVHIDGTNLNSRLRMHTIKYT